MKYLWITCAALLCSCKQPPKARKDASSHAARQIKNTIKPEIGNTARITYHCWLADKHKKPGRLVDESKQPFEFIVGTHRVIEGLDREIQHMHVGQTRTLVIPPALAYGTVGYGTVIPPQATLIFEVTLLAVK